jgi:hypothetical protein
MLPVIFGAILLAASAAYVLIQPKPELKPELKPEPNPEPKGEDREAILARLIKSGAARPSWGNQMPT